MLPVHARPAPYIRHRPKRLHGPAANVLGGYPKTLSSSEERWIGVGVGEPMTHEEQQRLISQGDNIYKLMLHHASYEALPAGGLVPAEH